MRKALNENPMVQLAVLGVCAVAFAVILFTSVLKKDDTSSATSADPAAATSDPAAPASASDPSATAPAPSSSATPPATAPSDSGAAVTPETSAASPPPTAGGTPADGLLPSKGLPQDLLVAFAKNQTIALLVIDPKGSADKQLKKFTGALRSRNDVEVFVVDVRDIAKYSRITSGVSVNRTPALVVIRPRKLTGSIPTATVSYGFRGPKSVNQAVDDAVYKGKQVQAYP